jgi:multidrug efflux pump subunit AcrA (membrane-fusion protein)
MRQRRHIVLAVTGVLVVTFLVYTALSSSSRSTAPAVSLKPQDKKSTPVQTITVQHGTISQRITATGDILADARVEVFPKVEGHLRELRVEEGDRVRAGQVMAQIADNDLRAAVARATAQVDALRAEWAQMQAGARPEEIAQAVDRVQHTRAEMENAEWMLERTQSLVERGMQSTWELEDATRKVTQARAAHSTAQKQLQLLRTGARDEERQALQARLRVAQEALRLATIELQNAVIMASMDGIVGRRHVDPGAYLTNTNTPIVTIVAMDAVKIRVPISERDIGRIQPGIRADIRVDAYPEEVFEGTVRRLSPLIDPASRNGEVEISIANPDHRLKPGMFAKVALILEQRHDVVVIPRDALRVGAQGTAVFVVQDGVAQLRQVTTGLQDDTRVEIVEALRPGTEIVLAGHQGLKDQDPVQVVATKE